MKNPRENIKYDIPKEWIINFKKGLCPVCGKTKFEFNKGMKVYCSEKCREEYSKRIYTWQELRDKIIKERGNVCQQCKKTQEQLTQEKLDFKTNKKKEFIKRYPEILEQRRKELMDDCEKLYIKAQKLNWEDITIPWEYRQDYDDELPYGWDSFEVDHKIAVVNGGDFWDENNLQVLCYKCHKEKTKEDLHLKSINNQNEKLNNKNKKLK